MVTPKFRGVTPQFLKYMYLGKRLWGRGSMDDKSGLIGIMSSIESLLENGFVPTRTVVMAFGFDEEASGIYVSTSVYSGPSKYRNFIYLSGGIFTSRVPVVDIWQGCICTAY
jgi:acetylornithine deacetylase/succinyl-diaminopimelate desuccinylase-like protein